MCKKCTERESIKGLYAVPRFSAFLDNCREADGDGAVGRHRQFQKKRKPFSDFLELLDKEPICICDDASLPLRADVLAVLPLASCTSRRTVPRQAHDSPHGAIERLTVERNLRRFIFPPVVKKNCPPEL